MNLISRNFKKISEEEQAKIIEKNIRKYDRRCKKLRQRSVIIKHSVKIETFSSKYRDLATSLKSKRSKSLNQ